MRNVALFRGALALALLGLATGAMAQSATGQITGTVKDATGAVVPGATVTVTSELTGSKREVVTGKDGNYSVPLLPVSTYSVTASLQGFKAAKRSAVKLNVDQVARVDLDLQTGELSESVEVQAGTAALDTETASVGQVISQKQITDLPLNGRNFISLLFLGAGAVEANGEQGSMRQGAGNAISIMGSRPTSNNFMIDGTSNVDSALGTPAAILSIDALDEFKEQTKTYSAEYGFSANQINLVSKSGTNQFHGTLFGFMRDDSLDAKNYFDPPNSEKPKLSQKQFGGVVTGPIIKNKTFFLLNYDGTRIDRGFSSYFRVPNPAELAGHFSSTIIDPTTGQPFPNNTIPSSRFSRLAQVAQDQGWFPAPNADSPLGNYSVVRTLPQTQNQFTVRIDQDLGHFGRAFARYTSTKYDNRQTTGNILDISDQIFVQNAKNWQVSHTWPIHSNLVNSFRLGHVWADAPLKPIACPQAAIDKLANTGLFQNVPDDQRNCPNIGFPSTGLSGTGGPVNAYSASTQPMWDISNTTTWIKGNHTLNIGANYRRWWLQRDLATDFTGNFTFGNGFTFTGSPVADYLLGYYTGASSFQPAGFSVPGQVGNPREMNFMYIAPYVQDDWKVNQQLTLNLGLRYDYRSVPYETNDHMGWRNLAYAPGGLLVADPKLQSEGINDGRYYQAAGRRNPDNPDKYKVFAPRLGFAYRPGSDEKTVIRGGWGRFYDSAEGREIDGAADIYPYVSRGNYSQSINQATPIKTTDQLFPSFSEQGVATPAANTFLAVSMSPEPRNPYVDQWSLGIQRQLTKSTVAELNYVGSKGNNLLMRINIAQALEYTPDNPTVAGRKPYPNFGVYIDSTWSGTSKYNALNAKIEHHGRDLLATFAYTYSKSTDSKSAAAGIGASGYNGWQGFLDNHNPGLDYGPSDFDVDHRAVASFVWNLPFGRGMKYGGESSGVKEAFIGGWQMNGIYIWQHGFPITIQAADVGNVFDSFGTNRANVSGDPNAGGGTIEKWFNTSAFSQPALGQFGNSTRNMLRAPTINNLDLALFKNFNLARGSRLQFRFESFNVFNHPNFTGVATNITDPAFGRLTAARPGRINQLGLKLIW